MSLRTKSKYNWLSNLNRERQYRRGGGKLPKPIRSKEQMSKAAQIQISHQVLLPPKPVSRTVSSQHYQLESVNAGLHQTTDKLQLQRQYNVMRDVEEMSKNINSILDQFDRSFTAESTVRPKGFQLITDTSTELQILLSRYWTQLTEFKALVNFESSYSKDVKQELANLEKCIEMLIGAQKTLVESGINQISQKVNVVNRSTEIEQSMMGMPTGSQLTVHRRRKQSLRILGSGEPRESLHMRRQTIQVKTDETKEKLDTFFYMQRMSLAVRKLVEDSSHGKDQDWEKVFHEIKTLIARVRADEKKERDTLIAEKLELADNLEQVKSQIHAHVRQLQIAKDEAHRQQTVISNLSAQMDKLKSDANYYRQRTHSFQGHVTAFQYMERAARKRSERISDQLFSGEMPLQRKRIGTCEDEMMFEDRRASSRPKSKSRLSSASSRLMFTEEDPALTDPAIVQLIRNDNRELRQKISQAQQELQLKEEQVTRLENKMLEIKLELHKTEQANRSQRLRIKEITESMCEKGMSSKEVYSKVHENSDTSTGNAEKKDKACQYMYAGLVTSKKALRCVMAQSVADDGDQLGKARNIFSATNITSSLEQRKPRYSRRPVSKGTTNRKTLHRIGSLDQLKPDDRLIMRIYGLEKLLESKENDYKQTVTNLKGKLVTIESEMKAYKDERSEQLKIKNIGQQLLKDYSKLTEEYKVCQTQMNQKCNVVDTIIKEKNALEESQWDTEDKMLADLEESVIKMEEELDELNTHYHKYSLSAVLSDDPSTLKRCSDKILQNSDQAKGIVPDIQKDSPKLIADSKELKIKYESKRAFLLKEIVQTKQKICCLNTKNMRELIDLREDVLAEHKQNLMVYEINLLETSKRFTKWLQNVAFTGIKEEILRWEKEEDIPTNQTSTNTDTESELIYSSVQELASKIINIQRIGETSGLFNTKKESVSANIERDVKQEIQYIRSIFDHHTDKMLKEIYKHSENIKNTYPELSETIAEVLPLEIFTNKDYFSSNSKKYISVNTQTDFTIWNNMVQEQSTLSTAKFSGNKSNVEMITEEALATTTTDEKNILDKNAVVTCTGRPTEKDNDMSDQQVIDALRDLIKDTICKVNCMSQGSNLEKSVPNETVKEKMETIKKLLTRVSVAFDKLTAPVGSDYKSGEEGPSIICLPTCIWHDVSIQAVPDSNEIATQTLPEGIPLSKANSTQQHVVGSHYRSDEVLAAANNKRETNITEQSRRFKKYEQSKIEICDEECERNSTIIVPLDLQDTLAKKKTGTILTQKDSITDSNSLIKTNGKIDKPVTPEAILSSKANFTPQHVFRSQSEEVITSVNYKDEIDLTMQSRKLHILPKLCLKDTTGIESNALLLGSLQKTSDSDLPCLPITWKWEDSYTEPTNVHDLHVRKLQLRERKAESQTNKSRVTSISSNKRISSHDSDKMRLSHEFRNGLVRELLKLPSQDKEVIFKIGTDTNFNTKPKLFQQKRRTQRKNEIRDVVPITRGIRTRNIFLTRPAGSFYAVTSKAGGKYREMAKRILDQKKIDYKRKYFQGVANSKFRKVTTSPISGAQCQNHLKKLEKKVIRDGPNPIGMEFRQWEKIKQKRYMCK